MAFFPRVALLLLALALAIGNVGQAAAGDLLVFAAASTKNALEEAADLYKAKGGAPITFSFAASSDLAKQNVASSRRTAAVTSSATASS
jgi:molybdate transport system substrate-binding protein